MMLERGESCAAFILRLLLDGESARGHALEVDWNELLYVARQNVVLVRVAERLERSGLQPPPSFAEAVDVEQLENRAKINLIRRISQAATGNNVRFIFAKAFQHFPDMGNDIDLYILPRSLEADALVLDRLSAKPLDRSLHNRAASTANYQVTGCEAQVEIYHGRMGMFAEHDTYLAQVIENGRLREVLGTEFLVPSVEDQLIIQGMQRVYARNFLRLSDIFYTINSIRCDAPDWGYIIRTSRRLGTFEGLCCYLSYVEQIYRRLLGGELLASESRRALNLEGWGPVEFKDGVYKFERPRVIGYIYKFRAAVVAGNWKMASRLCLLPLLGVGTVARKAASSFNKSRSPKEGAKLAALPVNERS
jgi:hypothetical protein